MEAAPQGIVLKRHRDLAGRSWHDDRSEKSGALGGPQRAVDSQDVGQQPSA
jgi:hypothetical protein